MCSLLITTYFFGLLYRLTIGLVAAILNLNWWIFWVWNQHMFLKFEKQKYSTTSPLSPPVQMNHFIDLIFFGIVNINRKNCKALNFTNISFRFLISTVIQSKSFSLFIIYLPFRLFVCSDFSFHFCSVTILRRSSFQTNLLYHYTMVGGHRTESFFYKHVIRLNF